MGLTMTSAHESGNPVGDRSSLISHGEDTLTDFDALMTRAKSRLRDAGDLPGASVAEQITLLEALSSFELGRFLLRNRGLDAYWTHRLVTYPDGPAAALEMSALERQLFEKTPAVLATRERFGIFRQQLQALLQPNQVVASVPCGLMGELLSLDYSRHAGVALVGIDLDASAIDGAQRLAGQLNLADRLSLRCQDAWTMSAQNEFDILTSNGLNLYEPDDTRVVALYRSFFEAIKPGGTLLTSFLTPPPMLSDASPWDLTQIDSESLALQHLLFVRIIEAKWGAFRTHDQTASQLEQAGFNEIQFIDDRARMFPTVTAKKRA